MLGRYGGAKPNPDRDIDLPVVDDSGRDKTSVALEISRALFPLSNEDEEVGVNARKRAWALENKTR